MMTNKIPNVIWQKRQIMVICRDKHGFVLTVLHHLDGVQPKMSPLVSFYGMYQKVFFYRSNRTNS